MFGENLKKLWKEKGLSQQEVALRLHVVRQTVSKWEQGLSVPDSDLLIALSEALEVPVSALLGETLAAPEAGDLKTIAEKLEIVNLQLARKKENSRRVLRGILIALCSLTAAGGLILMAAGSPYLDWNFADPETAVLGTAFHVLEWVFVRLAPIVFVGSLVGLALTRKRKDL